MEERETRLRLNEREQLLQCAGQLWIVGGRGGWLRFALVARRCLREVVVLRGCHAQFSGQFHQLDAQRFELLKDCTHLCSRWHPLVVITKSRSIRRLRKSSCERR